MSERPAIVLLRRDLRLDDNPALHAAGERGPVIALFVLDETEPLGFGRAARWWLHHSLDRLGEALGRVPLVLRRGDMAATVEALALETKAAIVTWNRRYAASEVARDKAMKARLAAAGIETRSFNGALLREPWEIETKAGGPYRVFSPFWRALRGAGPARGHVKRFRGDGPAITPRSEALASWGLLPTRPNWAQAFETTWTPGEKGAQDGLARFLDGAALTYAADRDRPDIEGTSRLSPHLAFGEISPLGVWRAVHARLELGALGAAAAESFLSELAWREFCYAQAYFNADIKTAPLRDAFAAFPWRKDKNDLAAWRKGRTGYPIVDAGMRQLWRAGWMHNRVRMIVASFLVKDLLLDWREGERWFWDTLVDADPANNPANWQWVAGAGADAAPYFRIFNPVAQGEKFDPEGDYVRRYAPELAKLSAEHIHKPWAAPADRLKAAGVVLGADYPAPLTDHAFARKRALEAFDSIKKSHMEPQ
ncbi:MAG: deoxyribodipyrimidine photo-lyase [Amphiplicatus sp.]